MAEIAHRIGYAHDISEARKLVNGELSKLPLNSNDRLRAPTLIVKDAERVNLFFSLPEEEKMEWVCLLLGRGANGDELKKVKHMVQYGIFAAYHLALETSFLADEGASLPELPLNSSLTVTLPDKASSIDRSISTIPGFTAPANEKTQGPQPCTESQGSNTVPTELDRRRLSLIGHDGAIGGCGSGRRGGLRWWRSGGRSRNGSRSHHQPAPSLSRFWLSACACIWTGENGEV
ncbi:1-phosphatidylinositol-3-phosphate 5-kinase FAB1B [Camellia lanceoleosa]|uniref:1-phosphatidylinositol-3-phosphate 5-kinase FAB1B n=1 Tax=Camellia lanceoleosa TaxID=1840588 RepID=A0ACC0I6Z3_9ERIC|nr:1-phosphatidylinositol-3-phosphate 5-kinase FAB1B [Camellia lanceoleosa]